MHDDQIRRLLGRLEDERDPDPAFADALYMRLNLVARHGTRNRMPMVLLAAALLGLLAAGLAVGGGLVPLPLVVDATGIPAPSPSAEGEPSGSAAPSVTPSAEASGDPVPSPSAPTVLAGRTLIAAADGLRVREGPASDAIELATLRSGQLMGATGSRDGEWVEVRIGPGNLQGWISTGPEGAWLQGVADGAMTFSCAGCEGDASTTIVLATPFGDDALTAFADDNVLDLTWSPDGTRVAMTVTADSGTDMEVTGAGMGIVVAAADGSDWREVGPGGVAPAWSPDGSRLAWTTSSGLAVTDADLVPTPLELDLRNPGSAIWSPDGSRLALLALDCPECPEDEPIMGDVPSALYVVEIATGASTKLSDPGYWGLEGWSADGTLLSVVTIDLSGQLPQQAFAIPVAGGSPIPLLGGEAVHEAGRWSPDGTRLAMGTPGGLVLTSVDGSGTRTLVPSDGFVSGVRWSPSGEWITYQVGFTDEVTLWMVAADGSEAPRQLTSTDAHASEAEWQPLLVPLP
ncbi:MAG TPA: hypothetical protein VM253_06240 [Candidatus Limnocylindrales bacterium]|nr:hypothetical protein [Candidatus Limnocylindrales bacterium]